MLFFQLEPEVAGGFGAKTILNSSVHPPIVKELHYEFYGWLGDDIVTSFPCYLVTEGLAVSLVKEKITGFELASVEVTKSEFFNDRYPNRQLPKFYWLKVTGQLRFDDIGLGDLAQLIVSKNAMNVFKDFKINNCEIEQLKI